MEDQLDEEIECLQNILECLTKTLQQISEFSSLYLNEDVDVDDKYLPTNQNENFKGEAMQSSFSQSAECFLLISSLLESSPSPQRIRSLIFENNPELIATCIAFIAIPVPIGLNEENVATVIDLKVGAINCMTRIISLCSYNESESANQDEDEQRELCQVCAEVFVEERGLDTMLHFLQSPFDVMRVAISECLFTYISRSDVGKLAFVLQKGLSNILKGLLLEKNATVKFNLCAIVREYCVNYVDEVLKENMINISAQLIHLDSSPEVRALNCEIIEAILKSEKLLALFDPKSPKQPNGTNLSWIQDKTLTSKLAQVLAQRLQKDTNQIVLESVCKLLETIFCVPHDLTQLYQYTQQFMRYFIEYNGWQAFIKCVKPAQIRPASLAVRALRYLVQNVDYSQYVGFKIITHFPSLSILLKAALDTTVPSTSIAHKLLKVELGICLGVILAQNPKCRKHLHQELKAFPLWMSTLRSALLSHLSLAEMEYFSDIRISDCTGADLLHHFQYDFPKGPAIKAMFHEQEKRVYYTAENSVIAEFSSNDILEDPKSKAPKTPPWSKYQNKSETSTFGKVRSFILSYAVHLTLSPNKFASSNPTGEKENKYENAVNQNTPPSNQPHIPRLEMEDSMLPNTTTTPTTKESSYRIEKFKYKKSSEDEVYQEEDDFPSNPKVKREELELPFADELNSAPVTPRNSVATPQSTKKRVVQSPILNRRSEALVLLKKFSKFYIDEKEEKERAERIKREQRELNFSSSPRKMDSLKSYFSTMISTGGFWQQGRPQDVLILRSYYSNNLSPKKLQKSWSDTDVKVETDLFEFNLSFELDFKINQLESLAQNAMKHHKTMKKFLLMCPQGANAKGRRTFLIDMFNNIMPRIIDVLKELVETVKEKGEKDIRMIIYIWKSKNRKNDTALTHYNIIPIFEYIKMHLASSTFEQTTVSTTEEPSTTAEEVTANDAQQE